MRTETLAADSPSHLHHAIEVAANLLREGQAIALPTETVYGLAADALDAAAVVRIFEAKERPLSDPLIVHLPSRDWIDQVVKIPKEAREMTSLLMEKFWPGPLTLVLPRRDKIPDLVTAGQSTVAVRMSQHPVFRSIGKAFGKPLAAPSANRFGKISPTTADHVAAELQGRIPLIVDGGPCTHGIESTIVAIHEDTMSILRHGPITEEQLSEFGRITRNKGRIVAPGSMKSHYAPTKPLSLLDDEIEATSPLLRCGLISWKKNGYQYKKTIKLSEQLDLHEAAANLYAAMREMDESDVEMIIVEPVPETGIGKAIMDRLRKAAARE
ncbi:MAG: L-threonylcarbamoyladenylate synthase [Chthoniobacterales bacterium]